MKHLYFIRHGESEFNKANKWASSTDTPLTKKGKTQATKAGKELREKGIVFDVIITSPLTRAQQTAKHIADEIDYPHDKILTNAQLTERDFGVLEGKKHLVAATAYAIDESVIDHYERVESLIDLQSRVNSVLDYLYDLPHETVLVVGHGAFGRALRRAVNNEPHHKRGRSFNNAQYEKLI